MAGCRVDVALLLLLRSIVDMYVYATLDSGRMNDISTQLERMLYSERSKTKTGRPSDTEELES